MRESCSVSSNKNDQIKIAPPILPFFERVPKNNKKKEQGIHLSCFPVPFWCIRAQVNYLRYLLSSVLGKPWSIAFFNA